MNNTKKIALAVAILCSAGTALAQEINPSWYIQPSVVHAKPDADFGVSDRDTGGGLKFGKAVNQYWDVQVGASQVRFEENAANYRQTLAGVDALLMLSRERFRPFVLFGLGVERDKVENRLRNVSHNSPYGTVGIGFQASLTPQWSLQADLRSVRGFLRHDEEYGFRRSNNKYLTVGLNYAFNPPPVAAAPAPAPAPVVEAPAPAPAPVAPPPPPPARFEKVTLEATKLFEFDKADVIMPSPKLDEIASALQADTSITNVDITGYTDRLGSEKYNLKLSERRANAVRDYLVSKGIDGNRLKAYGKGEANPLVQCNEKNRAALIACLEPNRRVEVEQITIEKRVQ
ncbi:OmpA family protein [Massilia sp. G4R7]|uniref:OmpA family protein n=1 Tax=Massilia phyllostachyos TaxID=2898585 RepID=A0ABS8Q2W1_9BURK|nr:OmpA family protein [uncultured Massilia sp.]MCD2516075.1 OmpA family protein [Massilia phyllostachyos]